MSNIEIDEGMYTIGVRPNDSWAKSGWKLYFEHNFLGDEIGGTIQVNALGTEVVDYDGVYELPHRVIMCLERSFELDCSGL